MAISTLKGDRERVLVAVVVQAVEEDRALFGQQALAVEQGGGGLEGVVLAAAEDVVEHEAEQAVVGPLAALDEEHLASGKEDNPAGRMRLAVDAASDDVAPALPEDTVRRGRLAVELGGVGLEGERVLVLARCIAGTEHEETDGAVLAAGEEHRHFVAVVEDVVVGRVLVAEGAEELAEPPALALDTPCVLALVRELAAELEVVARQGPEGLVRGPHSRTWTARRFGRLAPACDGAPDIPGEDLGEVVLAVELVLVVDAGERLRGIGDVLSPLPSSRSRRTGPARAGTRRGCA